MRHPDAALCDAAFLAGSALLFLAGSAALRRAVRAGDPAAGAGGESEAADQRQARTESGRG